MAKKYALCVGINDYPGTGSDLNGCVNDALDWAAFLTAHGYEVVSLLNEQATRTNILSDLHLMLANAKYLDRVVFTYSGHGSWIPDADGDEADGRDEVLVAHDYANGGLISDDDLNAVFGTRRFGVKPIIISDSCHSGSVNRFVDVGAIASRSVVQAQPRFLPPAHFLRAEQMVPALRVEDAQSKGLSRPTTALLSGCADPEYSYDAFIGGRPRGAFTATALAAYREGMSLGAWHTAIRHALPSDSYPQTPQLAASYTQKRWTL